MNFKFWREKATKKLKASETEFLPAILEIVETPPSPFGRLMLWTIIALIAIALLWSIFGHTDEVAVAPGKLIPTGYVKTIQAEDKGIITKINVRDGQKVKQGDVLLELNPVITEADFARLRKELFFYTVEIERLTAERDGTPFTARPLPGMDPKDFEYQLRLYQSRAAEFAAKKAAYEQSILQSESELAIARTAKDRYQSQYDVAKEKETRLQTLVEQNAVAYFVLLDQRARRMELEQLILGADASISKARFALIQSQESLRGYVAAWERETDTKMVDDRKQLQAVSEELKKAEEKNRLSKITAPIDGRVHQLAVHTLGGIVTAAQPLLILVPEDVTIEAEAWVANKDIGFVQLGQQAEVKVETFNFQKYGTVPAEIVELSPDAVEDKDKGRVYRVVLRLSKDSVMVGGRAVPLNPGMSVTAEIKTREKRVIEFFLDPFKKYQSEGLRER
ncbi:MAG TPA: HlyD family type I secretion periplasmic adaptor subunit [Negativicutes bacterium]|nr:HlyD family type I secretion periplasmic adaptor subunit [Negativicutes bacterium]